MAPHSSNLAWKIPWTEEPGGLQSMGSLRLGHDWVTSLSLFHFHVLEKEMATDSSVLAWRIPGMGEPGGLPSLESHRVGHDWSNNASGGDGIPVELFQILKMMLWKCCTPYANKFGKLSSGHRTGKGLFSFQFQRKAMPKNAQTTTQLHSSHMLVK